MLDSARSGETMFIFLTIKNFMLGRRPTRSMSTTSTQPGGSGTNLAGPGRPGTSLWRSWRRWSGQSSPTCTSPRSTGLAAFMAGTTPQALVQPPRVAAAAEGCTAPAGNSWPCAWRVASAFSGSSCPQARIHPTGRAEWPCASVLAATSLHRWPRTLTWSWSTASPASGGMAISSGGFASWLPRLASQCRRSPSTSSSPLGLTSWMTTSSQL